MTAKTRSYFVTQDPMHYNYVEWVRDISKYLAEMDEPELAKIVFNGGLFSAYEALRREQRRRGWV